MLRVGVTSAMAGECVAHTVVHARVSPYVSVIARRDGGLRHLDVIRWVIWSSRVFASNKKGRSL